MPGSILGWFVFVIRCFYDNFLGRMGWVVQESFTDENVRECVEKDSFVRKKTQ